ncbi:hypothetical protein BV25DRAFT_1874747 [Artomyces pyxidatus]|uniref:Uncharacterized protein n=1 Tax=Artomyces pyxidatus TaxID=48021 RepID=A0ACB8TL32_9AGAM|nr:hypothetical protein BV25DRAFT_1874747 [Artomyces pyxidatus]
MHSLAARFSSAGSSRAVRLARSQASKARSIPSRAIHVRRKLPYNVEDGMGDFLPPAALKMIAEDYQQGLLDRLNDETRPFGDRNTSVAQLVLNTASDPSRTLTFNYASLALNNSFFLHHLKAPLPGTTSNREQLSRSLGYRITYQIGGVDQLISSMSAAALGMVSNGWVWFVTDQKGRVGYLATYGAGTLLSPNRMHASLDGQEYGGVYTKNNKEDPAVPADVSASAPLSGAPPASPASGLARQAPPLHPSSPSRALHTSAAPRTDGAFVARSLYSNGSNSRASGAPSKSPHEIPDASETDFATIGETLFPLFCISVQEHAWLGAGYGVWGKEEYLKRFWSCLDWEKVSVEFEKWVPSAHIEI